MRRRWEEELTTPCRCWPGPSLLLARNAAIACCRSSHGDTVLRTGTASSAGCPAEDRKPRGLTRSFHSLPPTDLLPPDSGAADARVLIASGPRSHFIRNTPQKKDAVSLTLTLFPPLIRGGLIEASFISSGRDWRTRFPPLIRGGLIEAWVTVIEHASRTVAFPPLIRGGLIEAAIITRRSSVMHLGFRL